jgi:hypothetical protein
MMTLSLTCCWALPCKAAVSTSAFAVAAAEARVREVEGDQHPVAIEVLEETLVELHSAPTRLAHEVARLQDRRLRERHLTGEHVEARTGRRHTHGPDASQVGREPGHLRRAALRVSIDQKP